MVQVLVVDDDPVFREIAREVLVQAGHAVSLADDGAHAVEVGKTAAPDLAIVDMLMPERDGIETIRELRAQWPAIKLIAVSAGSRGLDAGLLLRSAMALGADASLEKPLNGAALLALVDQLTG
jgi:CheY-like chemotaxis protein